MIASDRKTGQAVTAPDTGNQFFRDVLNRYQGNPETLKGFAALILYEHGEFTTRELAEIFGSNSGQMSRELKKTRDLLREEFGSGSAA